MGQVNGRMGEIVKKLNVTLNVTSLSLAEHLAELSLNIQLFRRRHSEHHCRLRWRWFAFASRQAVDMASCGLQRIQPTIQGSKLRRMGLLPGVISQFQLQHETKM
jgi:hypothetical protein